MDDLYFVYGTLKSNQWNNHILRPIGATLVDKAFSEVRYLVKDVGFPMATPYPEGLPLMGEVYEVTSPHVVNAMDSLEGNGNFYTRVKRWFTLNHNLERIEAWIYEIPVMKYSASKECNVNKETNMWEWYR